MRVWSSDGRAHLHAGDGGEQGFGEDDGGLGGGDAAVGGGREGNRRDGVGGRGVGDCGIGARWCGVARELGLEDKEGPGGEDGGVEVDWSSISLVFRMEHGAYGSSGRCGASAFRHRLEEAASRCLYRSPSLRSRRTC